MSKKDIWEARARVFVEMLVKHTKLSTAPARDVVRAYQKIAGTLKVDGKAGTVTQGHLRRAFPLRARPANATRDKFPRAPLCSWNQAVYPVADDHPTWKYRVTSGFMWSGRDGKPHPETDKPTKPHRAMDITRRVSKKLKWPDSDGYHGAPKGSKVVACLPGVVIDIDLRGSMFAIALRHIIEGKEHVSYYGHIDAPAPTLHLGEIIEAGQFIALNGTSWKPGNPTLRHVHFSVHDASKSAKPWSRDSYSWRQVTAINLGGVDYGPTPEIHDGSMLKWRRVRIEDL